uniref:Schlafen AlbA-2 domain-containing protein n=1 Tax=Candidatus Methanophagaceae archaeon ANME-1 ERB6 TaxID=2759912 RepID=A0A7G9YSG4_9EURY|nr:hypothetical protein BBGANOMO_00022 [Methanosarcinales archaeon ANME-1 ERB6]
MKLEDMHAKINRGRDRNAFNGAGEMNQDELTELIRGGESETTEFKKNFDRETIETAGALSNTKGGIILIGVSNKAKVVGVQIGKETLKDWANQISLSTDPRVIPEIEHSEINGMDIVIYSSD